MIGAKGFLYPDPLPLTAGEPESSVLYRGIEELPDLEPAVLKQIEDFFANDQKVRDIQFEITAREGSQIAGHAVDFKRR